MTPDPVQTFLEAGQAAQRFPSSSRYYGLDTKTWKTADGRLLPYVARRFVPPAENFQTLSQHTIAAGDRVDTLTARYLGNPEQFWRVCDANNVIRPDELTETLGKKVRITLPEGVPAIPPHA